MGSLRRVVARHIVRSLSTARIMKTKHLIASVTALCSSTVIPVHATPPQYGVTDLGTLGGVESSANSINDSGQIAGWSRINTTNSNYHAVRWTGTTPFELATLAVC
jgi:probable HAF family extracellular repeat protein